MKYEIKRAVFIPGTRPLLPPERNSWPFKDMNVGDEVLITEGIPRARLAAHTYGAQSGKKFMTRKFEGGLHVYRIA